MNRTCILLVVCLAASAVVAQPAAVDVPVTRVVLFSSGVGYFEHTGQIEGEAVTQLMFKTDQINDVLKSMIVMDSSDTGGVTSVNYASREPLWRALQSFGVDLSTEPDLAELLNQLRGAEVVVLAPKEIKGKILKVEEVVQIDTDTGLEIYKYKLDLVTEEGIKSLSMESIQNIELIDKKLAGELNKALAVLLTSRDTERKPVDITFSGEGQREVRIGYVIETPVWKTSYRLDLTGDEPRLQGWAIVENTSDVDWTGVQLSLVSGRPISFVQDLYTPLYVPRPIVEPELYASLRPQTYAEGMFQEDEEMSIEIDKADRGRLMMVPEAPARPPMGGAGAADFFAEEDTHVGLYGMQSVAQAGQVGELFRFDIAKPVELPRRTSAMLPLIDTEIDAEMVSIYNASVMPRNPLNGAILKNDTGMDMLGGPITVLDDGMYAGDASIDHLAEGDKRLISYAVDLDVLVDSTSKSSSDITAVKIVRGTLIVTRKTVTTQEYKIENKTDDERILIVEHPYDQSQKLVKPEKFEELTDKWYRFRKVVPAGEEASLEVATERVQDQAIGILSYDINSLLWYVENGEIDKGVREALATAIQLRQKVAQLNGELADLNREKAELVKDQDRLRKDLSSVGRDSPLGQRYMTKLNEQEDRFEKIDVSVEEINSAIKAAEEELVNYLNELNVG